MRRAALPPWRPWRSRRIDPLCDEWLLSKSWTLVAVTSAVRLGPGAVGPVGCLSVACVIGASAAGRTLKLPCADSDRFTTALSLPLALWRLSSERRGGGGRPPPREPAGAGCVYLAARPAGSNRVLPSARPLLPALPRDLVDAADAGRVLPRLFSSTAAAATASASSRSRSTSAAACCSCSQVEQGAAAPTLAVDAATGINAWWRLVHRAQPLLHMRRVRRRVVTWPSGLDPDWRWQAVDAAASRWRPAVANARVTVPCMWWRRRRQVRHARPIVDALHVFRGPPSIGRLTAESAAGAPDWRVVVVASVVPVMSGAGDVCSRAPRRRTSLGALGRRRRRQRQQWHDPERRAAGHGSCHCAAAWSRWRLAWRALCVTCRVPAAVVGLSIARVLFDCLG